MSSIKGAVKKYKGLSVQIKATLWFTISNILQKGVMFLAVPIFIRILSIEQYGNYNVVLSWLEIFEILATFRIGWGGYIVGLNQYEEDRDAYTSSMQMLSIVITGVMLGVYAIFSGPINAFTKMSTGYTLLIFGMLFAMPAIQFWTVRERVELRYLNVLKVTVTSSVLIVGVGSIAALFSDNKDFAVLVARLCVQGVIAVVLIWHNCHRKFTFFHKEYWLRALRFNVPLLPYYMSLVVLHSSDRLIIDDLIGKTAVAVYGVAYTVSTIMQLFNTSITQALQPWLYKQMKEDKVDEVPHIITFTMLLIALINLMFISIAPEFFTIFAPAKYHEAIWIMPSLIASVVVMYFYQNFVNVEFYFEESRLTAIASIGAAALNIGLNYYFVPKYGYFAAGYTTLASYSVFAIVHYIFMRIVCKKKKYDRHLFDMGHMCLIMFGFFGLSIIMMVGYKLPIIRYSVLAIIIIVVVIKRKLLIQKINSLINMKKKK